MQRVRERGEETLTALAQRLVARLPVPKERQVSWFLHGLALLMTPFLMVAALVVIVLLDERYGVLLFALLVLGLGWRYWAFRKATLPLSTKEAVRETQRLRGELQRKIPPDDVPALLSLMERLGQQPGSEAKALALELQDALTPVLPFLTFIELQSLKAEHKAFLIATLRERTGLSGAVSADWVTAVLLLLGTLQDSGAVATARTLVVRDLNERVREAARDYLTRQ
jgi:hypothetical protein